MADILSAVGSVLATMMTTVGQVAHTIAGTTTVGEVTSLDNPLLFVFCIIPLVGLGVGLFRRLMNVN